MMRALIKADTQIIDDTSILENLLVILQCDVGMINNLITVLLF